MRSLLIIGFFLTIASASFLSKHTKLQGQELNRIQAIKESQGHAYPQEQWFDQELDHFNVQERRTWKQRYFVNDEFYKPGGPIFFQVGGEGAISPGYVKDLMMATYAKNEGALQVALEHRFYGKSHPFPTLDTQNLVYLHSEQALADASTFLNYIKSQYPNAGPIITFGGSYPGNLASWFRLKYPHITMGAIASSAPVLAVLDMTTYLDVVDQSLAKLAGEECDAQIRVATQQVQQLLKSQAGRNQLQIAFNTCTPLISDKDVATFMSNLMGNWMGVVQYNNENPDALNIKDICDVMENTSNGALNNYITVANMFLPGPSACLQVSYKDMVAGLRNVTSFGPFVGDRQWTYQTCAEFGYFQSTDSPNQPFGDLVPVSYYTDLCRDVFGFTFLPRIDETNIHYGARNPDSTNVVFVNGNIDPWHSLSVLKPESPLITAILIDGTAHCANMRPAKPRDPPGLAKAQKQIAEIIHNWLHPRK